MNFIEMYAEEEQRAIARSTFTERKVFSPFTHNLVNDPTRIASVSELPYFVCTMHNERAEDTVDNLLNGLTEDEGRLLRRVVTKLLDLSSGWGCSTAPHSSLLRHFYQRRLIQHLLPDAQSFLEIGPGTGYLSLMLALNGKGVANTDVTQAYYLFQHYLYDSFGCLSECAGTTALPWTVGREFPAGKIQHMPWWIYKDLAKSTVKVDVIVVNHAICEMHIVAVQHLLAVAHRLGSPKFFMESTGSDIVSLTFDQVRSLFLTYGYSCSYAKHDVYIFEHTRVPRQTAFTVGRKIRRVIGGLIPFMPVFKKERHRLTSQFMTLYRRFTGRHSIRPSIFERQPLRYADVSRLYEEISGTADFKSLDESFLDRIGKDAGGETDL